MLNNSWKLSIYTYLSSAAFSLLLSVSPLMPLRSPRKKKHPTSLTLLSLSLLVPEPLLLLVTLVWRLPFILMLEPHTTAALVMNSKIPSPSLTSANNTSMISTISSIPTLRMPRSKRMLALRLNGLRAPSRISPKVSSLPSEVDKYLVSPSSDLLSSYSPFLTWSTKPPGLTPLSNPSNLRLPLSKMVEWKLWTS